MSPFLSLSFESIQKLSLLYCNIAFKKGLVLSKTHQLVLESVFGKKCIAENEPSFLNNGFIAYRSPSIFSK